MTCPALATTLLVHVALWASAPTAAPPARHAAQSKAPPPAESRRNTPPRGPDLAALQLQVMLDRAGFSPGVIDGQMGANTERALALFQQHRGETSDQEMLPLATYTVTEADTAGPFTPEIPSELPAQAALPALGYRSVLEALAERFHATPELLTQLNPGATFGAGEAIQVPNVEPFVPPTGTLHVNARGEAFDPAAERPAATSGRGDAAPAVAPAAPAADIMSRPDVVVTVSRSASRLTVTDSAGQLVFSAPVSTGSTNDPLPIGEWRVTGLQLNPAFHYNPALFWDADATDPKARIAPGPNNPVGVVWIDLSKEHYGIHGTPEPATIARTESHGCVRLTNWDAARLAALVKPGTVVHFVA